MDRFKEGEPAIKIIANGTLKSNMDRFIEVKITIDNPP